MRLVEEGPPTSRRSTATRRTPEGIALFREWLRNTELPPIVRDALQCKLEFLSATIS